MLADRIKNSLEIYKLELVSSREPLRIHTLRSLESPALEPCTFVVVSTIDKE